MENKPEDVIDKIYEFGGPQLGLAVFIAPFFPILMASYHIGMLLFLPLGLYFSYSIIDTTDKLKLVFYESKPFQKKIVVGSVINLVSLLFFHYFVSLLAILSVALYCSLTVRNDYENLAQTKNT